MEAFEEHKDEASEEEEVQQNRLDSTDLKNDRIRPNLRSHFYILRQII